jgi:hypothetical protein
MNHFITEFEGIPIELYMWRNSDDAFNYFLNFYGGFYLQEGLTRNVRTINFDRPDTPVSKELRLDIQYGVKAGWFIPFYKRQPKEFYYN